MEELTEDEKIALRGSKFAPLPTSSRLQPRLAHPGGPMKTNKAAALAKFLERKLKDPNGLASLDPRIVELAVKNAKDTVQSSSGTSSTGRTVEHVNSFGDSEESEKEVKVSVQKKNKKSKKRKELKKEKHHKVEPKKAKKKRKL